MDKNLVLISSAIAFKDSKKGKLWLLVKNTDDGQWEFPRIVVRKVESSVRAAIRMMGEQAGSTIRVIEEAGRAGGVTTLGNQKVPQRHLYYLAKVLSYSGEVIGFSEHMWLETSKVTKKLNSKREKQMFKEAKKLCKEWEAKEKEKERAEKMASLDLSALDKIKI